jgi:hypothetical protein
MKKVPPAWPPLLQGPHAASLSIAENSFRSLNCSEHKLPSPACAGDKFPSLEQLLCSLVHRAEHSETEAGTCEAVFEPAATLGGTWKQVGDAWTSMALVAESLVQRLKNGFAAVRRGGLAAAGRGGGDEL